MPFGPVEPFDLVALEERVLARWREDDVVELVRKAREDGEPWIFYEGPPSANGRPGLHHVWARVFKDLYPRFQTMRGRKVPRKGGWDCHGLPVEIGVEQELGLSSKRDIEAYGIEAFNEKCRESVHRYVEDWAAITERSGVWIDVEDAYWTLSNDFIESVWWLLKRIWDKGLLYEGHRVSPYCPRCGTALSSHEMGQPGVYRDVTDPSVYVRFPLLDEDADLMVWTTTPWTLISNVAAVVGPDMTYVRVHEPDGRDLIMAETAAARFFGEGAPYDVVERWTGTELVGKRYRRPYEFLPVDDTACVVVTADYVSADDGSGIVHTAPAFGEDDAQTGRAHGLPVLNPVTAAGTFDERITPWVGLGVKQADSSIVTDLEMRGLLVREEPYLHSYPHCWRCSTPLIYWAKTSWFARTSELRSELLAENERINWYPEHIKEGRFGKWLENNVDWALSRDRYWGTPLPIWRCEQGHDTCIGSVAELTGRSGRDLTDLDLHRPHVDEVTITCDECGGIARRIEPVLDVWFDSGAMPTAQQHFPFATGDAGTIDTGTIPAFPADFICEAIDQTRGWFYSLLAVNTLAFGSTPYANVVCLGHIVDGEGQKMSKSRGNVIDPWYVTNTYGADALRWYFLSAGQPWSPRRVSEDGIRESTRQTLLTLWNVWSFFATYADLDGWTPSDEPPTPSHALDRWVLGELDDTVAGVTQALEGFDAFTAATRIARFVDDLSNWYVRRSRPRFWKQKDPDAYATLHRCLAVTAELLAPFTPFLADELWRSLTGGFSVHAADWPTATGAHDPNLAVQVDAVRRLVALGRAARTDGKIKTRQPLRRALLLHPGVSLDDASREELESELNVKVAETIEGLGGIVSWTAVPNFRTLGPRLGPKVNEVKQALVSMDGGALRQSLDEQGWVEVAGERLGPDDLEVRAERHGQFALAQEGAWAVALDLELDDDLLIEGTARELSRVINDLRKERGFAIADRIQATVDAPADGRVAAALGAHGDWVAGEVLAVSLRAGDAGGLPVDVDGETVRVELVPAG